MQFGLYDVHNFTATL